MILIAEQDVRRFWDKVDDSGECWLWTGSKSRLGYGHFRYQNKIWKAHRFAMQLTLADHISPTLAVDHICHNSSCVRPGHLRLVTTKQNMENRAGARRDSSSGLRGVSWHKGQGAWSAYVGHQGKQYSLGYYADKFEAAKVAEAKRNELFTHNERDTK